VTGASAPSPQARRQIASGEHASEQESVQRMSQVAPSLHYTLPLAPTVIVHVEPPEQSTLHELPQLPLHSLSIAQASVQLEPAQAEPSMSQAVPLSQAHEVPVQVGGGTSSPPQAAIRARTAREDEVRMGSVPEARRRGRVATGVHRVHGCAANVRP
jgi:hypothetical protein